MDPEISIRVGAGLLKCLLLQSGLIITSYGQLRIPAAYTYTVRRWPRVFQTYLFHRILRYLAEAMNRAEFR